MLLCKLLKPMQKSYVHVDRLAITFLPTDNSCHKYQGVLGDKITDTSLEICTMTGMRLEIKLESRRQGKNDRVKKNAEINVNWRH